MGIFSKISGLFSHSRKNLDELQALLSYGGLGQSKSGAVVNYSSALAVTTVLACLRAKANGIAQVPLRVFRSTNGHKAPAEDHPLYDILEIEPNEFQSSFELRQTLELHRQLLGNAYALVNRVGGKVTEILPLDPTKVLVKQNNDWSLTYNFTINSMELSLPRAGGENSTAPLSVFHLRGPSWNGWMGLDLVKQAREAIGLALATEERHASLHRNGVQASGILSLDGPLSASQYGQIRSWIADQIGGAQKNSLLILDRGARFASTTMTGVDAQHLETRKFQIEEVCRVFGVFPQMVGHTDKTSTYASSESFFIAHVVHTLAPEYTAWEQAIAAQLLSKAERNAGLRAKFITNGLMRGAMKDRAQFYKSLHGIGVMNANEIRDLEEMNPYEGGEKYWVPMNMQDPNAPPQDNTQGKV